MIIHLSQIPHEGLHIEGEEDPKRLDLPEGIDIVAAGPLRFSLDVGISNGGLFASGRLEIEFQLRCVSCLQPFPFKAEIPDFAVQLELTGPETVDLTPYVREDTLLALPAHPRCDWDGSRSCEGPPVPPNRVADGEDAAKPDAWSALDQLDPNKFK